MGSIRRDTSIARLALIIAVSGIPDSLIGQSLPPITSRDTVTVVASNRFSKGGFHRFLFGENYRDIWATPIKAPVLDLAGFAGGLKATETGGGRQTRSLRFAGADGRQYVFRPVFKSLLDIPDSFKGTLVYSLVMDSRSASPPAGAVSPPPLLTAAGVLHAPAALVAMPDDERLGEFRKEFAGLLGTIEENPDVPKDNPGAAFAGAIDIENSEDLLEMINKSPADSIDARAFLRAVLVDMLLNDDDRHAGQWKWARLSNGGMWTPIPRDRDRAFTDYEGFLIGMARMARSELVKFGPTFPNAEHLFHNAIEFERRLLSELDKAAWDSVVTDLRGKLSDPVLNAAMAAQPPEYAATNREILANLRIRRDSLKVGADEYYAYMASVVDIHGTDAAEKALVEVGEGGTTVTLRTGNDAPYYVRRFIPAETREIRIYLHGGDDDAEVTGGASAGIVVRIIGGNGNNNLINRGTSARLYDNGQVTGIKYDLVDEVPEDDELALPYNRRPLLHAYGTLIEPIRDRGATFGPTIGFRTGHGLGFTPKIGLARVKYGFRKYPYASMQEATVAYSTGVKGFELGFETDNRFEGSNMHITSKSMFSQIGVADFRGFGNDALDDALPGIPEPDSRFYRVNQKQYLFTPAIGFSFAPRSDLSIGPIVRYTVADSTAPKFISTTRPYGFRRFGQAGAQLRLFHDTRIASDTGRSRGGYDFSAPVNPLLWGTAEITGSYYPAAWDVESAYESLAGVATAYLTFPVATRPVLALRAGGQKLFGDSFPWFDAAFIGGSSSLRTEQRQRYAGDAAVHGSAELRLPVLKFPFILPLDVGLLGFADMARVYVDGDSPGGWHRGMGGGVWIGAIKPETNVTIVATDNPDRRLLVSLGFAY